MTHRVGWRLALAIASCLTMASGPAVTVSHRDGPARLAQLGPIPGGPLDRASQPGPPPDPAPTPATPPVSPTADSVQDGLLTSDPKRAIAPGAIVIGVREDARPFSYRLNGLRRSDSRFPRSENESGSPPSEEKIYYDGYVVRICGSVIAELQRPEYGLTFHVKEVVADERNAFLLGQNTSIDILCDPATITNERLELMVSSAPIYLSGITLANRRPLPARYPCGLLLGMVEGTTAETEGLSRILAAGEIPTAAPSLRADLNGTFAVSEDCKAKAVEGGSVYLDRPLLLAKTHREVAEAFCNGRIFHYVGDIEIVRENLLQIPDCDFDGARLTYKEERYAIFGRVPSDDEAGKARKILQFFRELSKQSYNKDSVLISSYESTFPEYTPSVKLKALFWSLTEKYPGSP